MVLLDIYERDYDNFTTIAEITNDYKISSLDYQKIWTLITDEYKNA
ncbi:MAG: hypothetical protein LBD46_04700 [Endomicrobium sp.]|jgi:hypothetical protein|nr:hypothetical protein [Endomicrobium sp.]